MDQYASVIGDNGSDSDYKSIATYYQRSDNNFKAGIFFMKAKEYAKVWDISSHDMSHD